MPDSTINGLTALTGAIIDKPAIEASLQQQIDDQINPPLITPPLPWAATQN